MQPPIQKQHKVPQVYLRKFSYKEKDQWKVSVLQRGERFTRQKSIESFTASANIFDIDSHDPRITRMFEKLNCDLENEYNTILSDLDSEGKLTDKSYAFLLQIIANLIVRSDVWRDWVLNLLKHQNKENFIKSILAHHCKDEDEFKNIDKQDYYRVLIDSEPSTMLNRVLIYFIDYFLYRLWNYKVVLIEAHDDKKWHTSTNPVVLNLKPMPFDIFSTESEIYFPVSPRYLAYLHHKDSSEDTNPLRTLKMNAIHQPTEEQVQQLQNIIINNPSDYIIFPIPLKYKVGEDEASAKEN